MDWPLRAETLIPGISHSQVAGDATGVAEGRLIVLLFLGVCALIAVHQLIPALKKLFKAPEPTASRAAETRKSPGDRS